MSITAHDRRYHSIYQALPSPYRDAIDRAWDAASAALREDTTFLVAGDDRAEALACALTRLLVESNPNDATLQAAVAEVDAP